MFLKVIFKTIKTTGKKKSTIALIWKQKPLQKKEGYYLLRTTLD
jgi:hypothetical protein